MDVVNPKDAVRRIAETWSPGIVGRVNDHHLKVARIHGEFVWHAHAESDEAFLVLRGELILEMRDRTVTLGEGDLFVVPAGVEHRPVAPRECHILMIEAAGTVNTGDAGGDRTVDATWIA